MFSFINTITDKICVNVFMNMHLVCFYLIIRAWLKYILRRQKKQLCVEYEKQQEGIDEEREMK